MPDSWLDHIPSHEREKIMRRLRSPEEYERLREKVKGPKELAREMEQSALLAELRFGLETEPAVHDALKAQVEFDLHDKGLEQVLDLPVNKELSKKIEHGKFQLTVSTHPVTHHDHLSIMVSEGNVQENIPLKASFNEQYLGQFQKAL